MCFHALFLDLERNEMEKFLFLGTHKKNRDNGNPTINDFILISEFDSNRNTCPDETEFVTCYSLV